MVQQKIVGKAKKEYTPPSDPGWSRQWSLVSPLLVTYCMTLSYFVSYETYTKGLVMKYYPQKNLIHENTCV